METITKQSNEFVIKTTIEKKVVEEHLKNLKQQKERIEKKISELEALAK